MKKIIPAIALLGLGLITSGCSNYNSHTINIDKEIKTFASTVNQYTDLNDNTASPVFKKYKLSLCSIDNTTNSVLDANITQPADETYVNETETNIDTDNNIMLIDVDLPEDKGPISTYPNNTEESGLINENTVEQTDEDNTTNNSVEITKDISTLYSLTEDIDSYSEQYLTLKENINSAIKDTENLISKVKNGEITLNAEQRMMISNQSKQLKQLSQELSRSTTKLNLELVDLNELLRTNVDTNILTLKYLAVLDNLANGNEMLENGLSSLILINQIFNANVEKTISNGKLIYGFKKKNEPVEIKQYDIKDGIIEENLNNNNLDSQPKTLEANEETNKEKKLQTNIDTYGNNYRNIDSFFNTALLDNQFMYGGNGFGMNGFTGTYNPYVYNNMVNQNTENNQTNNPNDNQHNKLNNKDKKKFTKNIDTYKSNKNSTLSAKIKNLKDSFKINKQKIKKPSYKYEEEIKN